MNSRAFYITTGLGITLAIGIFGACSGGGAPEMTATATSTQAVGSLQVSYDLSVGELRRRLLSALMAHGAGPACFYGNGEYEIVTGSDAYAMILDAYGSNVASQWHSFLSDVGAFGVLIDHPDFAADYLAVPHPTSSSYSFPAIDRGLSLFKLTQTPDAGPGTCASQEGEKPHIDSTTCWCSTTPSECPSQNGCSECPSRDEDATMFDVGAEMCGYEPLDDPLMYETTPVPELLPGDWL